MAFKIQYNLVEALILPLLANFHMPMFSLNLSTWSSRIYTCSNYYPIVVHQDLCRQHAVLDLITAKETPNLFQSAYYLLMNLLWTSLQSRILSSCGENTTSGLEFLQRVQKVLKVTKYR